MSLERLSSALYEEEVARARAMPPDLKLLEGVRLFERACRVMADGIRDQHAGLDDTSVQAMVAARLSLSRTLDGQ